jgi:hypothetical protein
VEGSWLVIVRKEGKVVATAVTHIAVVDYSIRLSGVNYDDQGITASTFRSDLLLNDWPTLQFKHSTQPSEGNSSRLEGYGEIQFFERNGPPKQYSGFFINLGEGIRYNVMGLKAEGKELLAHLDSPQMRIEELRRFSQAIEGTGSEAGQ